LCFPTFRIALPIRWLRVIWRTNYSPNASLVISIRSCVAFSRACPSLLRLAFDRGLSPAFIVFQFSADEVTAADNGEEIKIGGLAIRFLLEGKDTDGSLAMFEFDVAAGAKLPGALSTHRP
jgi:hypothetical protein